MCIKHLPVSRLLAACVIAASGCASNPVSELYEFYPVETNSESKLFEYQFILDPAERRSGTKQTKIPQGFAVSFNDMRAELDKYMKAYSFCLEGYFVYDESFDGQRYILRGECQESK